MKIVINRCFGGFSLSSTGIAYYYRLKGILYFFYYLPFWDRETQELYCYKRISCEEINELSKIEQSHVRVFTKDFGPEVIIEITSEDYKNHHVSSYDIDRTDEDLIKTVTDLGGKANSIYSKLIIVEIPDDVQWEIEEYDGLEWITDEHQTWGEDE